MAEKMQKSGSALPKAGIQSPEPPASRHRRWRDGREREGGTRKWTSKLRI
jgi:hypothetical protein